MSIGLFIVTTVALNDEKCTARKNLSKHARYIITPTLRLRLISSPQGEGGKVLRVNYRHSAR